MLEAIDDKTLGAKGSRAEDYLPSTWQGGTVQGKRYSLPLDVPQHILYLNAGLMKQAGPAGAAGRPRVPATHRPVHHSGRRSVMSVRLESVTFTSRDGVTNVPSYLATPDGQGPHPVVLILRGVAGPDDGYTEIARRLAEWGYVALYTAGRCAVPTRRTGPCTPICRER